jgi:N,N-dimethylformamidase beta subunit-like, C-terminal
MQGTRSTRRFISPLIALALLASACSERTRPPVRSGEKGGTASSGLATTPPNGAVQVAFARTSYTSGSDATLTVHGTARRLRIRLFHAGWGRDGPLQGAPVSAWSRVARPGANLEVEIGSWPSGLYYARVDTPGRGSWYAPFVIRPRRLGEHRVAVILPTNTWQAYNFENGDSWYLDPTVHTIELHRPYLDGGVPPHYRGYDRGFLRWLAMHHDQPDFFSDDDVDATASGDALARAYRLIVVSGHEEYVTGHEFDVVQRYRDLGGNLAFLSANNFFYKVVKHGGRMDGRWRWRDVGRPEASLVGEQYVDWNHDRYSNRPFRVTGSRLAPWLFRGTGLGDGSIFGVYGIEIDAIADASPPGTKVLARIENIFGPGKTAEMTYYTTANGARVFSAGVMNFGGSALWPRVRTMIANIWTYLGASAASRPTPTR